jgi:glycosyltransferase involved in cell wall biosynthesis
LDCKRHYIEDQKIIVIPNIIDVDEYSWDHDINYINSTIGIPSSSQRIIWVGRLDPDKIDAITSLINSVRIIVKNFPDVQVFIIGQGRKYKQVRELAERVNNNLAKEVIIVTGFLKDIKPAMMSADIIVGMGRVVIEAMACGKPVIVVGHIIGQFGGNFGGILTKDNAFLFKKYNYSGRNSKVITTPDRISSACIKLLADKNLRENLGKFGKHFVEKEHDARIIAKRIESIYRDVIAQRNMKIIITEF